MDRTKWHPDRLAFSLAEVGSMMGVGRSSIAQRCALGYLARTKVGDRVLVLREDALRHAGLAAPDAREALLRWRQDRVSLRCGEVARALGVDRATVRRWAQAGIVPATRIGRAWHVVRDGLVRALLVNRTLPRWES